MAGPGGWVLALALLTQGLAVADLAAQHRTAKSLPDSKIGGFFGRHMVEVPRIDDAALRPAGSRTDGLRGARGLAETLENPTAPGQARISTHGPDLKPVGVGESLGGSPASNTTEFVAESPGLESVAINITSRTLVLHWTGKVDITFAADIKLDGQIAFVLGKTVLWLGSGSAVIPAESDFSLPDSAILAVRLSDADMASIARSCPVASSIDQTFVTVTDRVLRGKGGVGNLATPPDATVLCTDFTRGPETDACCVTHPAACPAAPGMHNAPTSVPTPPSIPIDTSGLLGIPTTAPAPPSPNFNLETLPGPTIVPVQQRALVTCTTPATRSANESQPAIDFAFGIPAELGDEPSAAILLNACDVTNGSQSQGFHFVTLSAGLQPGMTIGELVDCSHNPVAAGGFGAQVWLHLDSADTPRVFYFTLALDDPGAAGPDEKVTASVNCPIRYVIPDPGALVIYPGGSGIGSGIPGASAITRISPSSGAGGTLVTIDGMSLRGDGSSVIAVQFAGVEGRIVSENSSRVVAHVGGNMVAGPADVVLVSSVGGRVRGVDMFTILPPPTVIPTLAPTIAPALPTPSMPTAAPTVVWVTGSPQPPPSQPTFAPASAPETTPTLAPVSVWTPSPPHTPPSSPPPSASSEVAPPFPSPRRTTGYTTASSETTATGDPPHNAPAHGNASTESPPVAHGAADSVVAEVPTWVGIVLGVVAMTTFAVCVAGMVRKSSAGISDGTRPRRSKRRTEPIELEMGTLSSGSSPAATSDDKESGSGSDSEGKKSKRRRRMDDLSSEQWQRCLQDVSERVFDRLVTSSKADENSAAAILARILAGAHCDIEPDDETGNGCPRDCFLVQRTDGSKSKYQVQAGAIRMVAQKSLYLAYRRSPLVDVEPVQIRQTCTYPDGTWWCLEPTHLDRTILKRVSPFIVKYPIPGPANALLPNGKDGQKQPKGTKGKPAKLPRAHKVAVKQEPGDLAGHTGPAIVPALLQGAALPLYMGVGQPGLASDGATHWQDLDGTSAPAQQLPSLPFQFGIGGQHQLSSLSAFASQDQASQLVSSLTGMGGGSYFGPVQTNVQPAISSLLPFGPRPTVVGQLFDPAAVIPTSTAGPSYSQLYEGEVELELSTLFPGLGPTGGVATSNVDASMAGASAYPGVMGGTGTAISTRINSLAGFSMMTHSAARPV